MNKIVIVTSRVVACVVILSSVIPFVYRFFNMLINMFGGSPSAEIATRFDGFALTSILLMLGLLLFLFAGSVGEGKAAGNKPADAK